MQMDAYWLKLSALAAVAMLLAGCATARRDQPLAGPLAAPSPVVRHGQTLFLKHCQQCHPGGDAGVGPALNNKPLPGFMIKTQVRMGFGAMPSFSGKEISRADLRDIVAYLKALRRHQVSPAADDTQTTSSR